MSTLLILIIDLKIEAVSWEELTARVWSLPHDSSNHLKSNNPKVNRDIKEGYRMPRAIPVIAGIFQQMRYFQLL